MLEQSPDRSGVLFQTRWEDEVGDHFAGWVNTSHGYEFVVPKDRTKQAERYVYPAGFYRIMEIDGIKRPIPNTQMQPVATLIPK